VSLVYVALLRGINVGGKNRLPMKDLVSIFDCVGCTDVRTYIQSGNVVFQAEPSLAERVPALATDEVRARFGHEIPIVVRDAKAMRRVVARNPFLEGSDVAHLSVAFLAAKPTPAAVRTLDPDRSPPDEFKVSGRELYLCCPNGAARTKLTNQYFDSRLQTITTVRNWRTVLALLELVAA
jgi:uncharacterized protein (DUF1697 family)